MVVEKACLVVFGVKLDGAQARALAKDLDAEVRMGLLDDEEPIEASLGMESFVMHAEDGALGVMDTEWSKIGGDGGYLVGFALGEEGLEESSSIEGFDPDTFDPSEIFAGLFEREVRPMLQSLGIEVGEPGILRAPIEPF